MVLVLDAVAPGIGSSLASVPYVGDFKLKLFKKTEGELSGVYEPDEPHDCFLGSTSLTGAVSGGPEATALVKFKTPPVTAGVYVGGSGTWNLGICPDLVIEGFTGRMYAGAFAKPF